MRRGFSLTEMLAVMAILTVISIALAGAFTTVINDIPRSYRVIQTNTTVLNMLERMRQDINAARGLPEEYHGLPARDTTAKMAVVHSNDGLLLIEMNDAVISYMVMDDKVLRCNLMTAACPERSRGDSNEVKNATVWPVPHAKINWQVWRENGKGYAVEVKTHIEHMVRGHLEKKMANSHLYFVGACNDVLR